MAYELTGRRFRELGKGFTGSVLTFLIVGVLLVSLYKANNGDIVAGFISVANRIVELVSYLSDKLLSFSWFRSAVSA